MVTKKKTKKKTKTTTKRKPVKKRKTGKKVTRGETKKMSFPLDLEYWRREITLAGLFLAAVGIIWFLTSIKAVALPTTLLPLLVIFLGFIMALAGVKES